MQSTEQRNVVADLRAMMAEHARQKAADDRQRKDPRDPRISTAQLLRGIMGAIPGGDWKA